MHNLWYFELLEAAIDHYNIIMRCLVGGYRKYVWYQWATHVLHGPKMDRKGSA